jgi:hypothetical protein
MPEKTIHCSLCGQAITGYDFPERMDKLRKHRKMKHPKAHKQSVKKSAATKRKKRKLDPLKTRTGLIANPQVKSYKDTEAMGTIRVLQRKNAPFFPELALTVPDAKTLPSKTIADISTSLESAGFTFEGRGKWVLRTNKFNIFVYI